MEWSEEPFWTLAECCEYLNCTRNTVLLLVGRLAALHVLPGLAASVHVGRRPGAAPKAFQPV